MRKGVHGGEGLDVGTSEAVVLQLENMSVVMFSHGEVPTVMHDCGDVEEYSKSCEVLFSIDLQLGFILECLLAVKARAMWESRCADLKLLLCHIAVRL